MASGKDMEESKKENRQKRSRNVESLTKVQLEVVAQHQTGWRQVFNREQEGINQVVNQVIIILLTVTLQ